MSEDFGERAQRAGEERLAACSDWLDRESDTDDQLEGEYPASAPYCGCDTCLVREVLDAAWPILEGEYRGLLTEAASRLELFDWDRGNAALAARIREGLLA